MYLNISDQHPFIVGVFRGIRSIHVLSVSCDNYFEGVEGSAGCRVLTNKFVAPGMYLRLNHLQLFNCFPSRLAKTLMQLNDNTKSLHNIVALDLNRLQF